MPQSRKALPKVRLFTHLRTVAHFLLQASMNFTIKGFRVSSSNNTMAMNVTVVSSSPPRKHDGIRLPFVDYGFEGWPCKQPYIHDCDIIHNRERFRIFFQRHRHLAWNTTLAIHGDLVIMQVGKKNVQNVVNARAGDRRRTRLIARR